MVGEDQSGHMWGADPLRTVALQESIPQAILNALSLHPILTDVAIMALFGIVFIVPAVWLFNKQD